MKIKFFIIIFFLLSLAAFWAYKSYSGSRGETSVAKLDLSVAKENDSVAKELTQISAVIASPQTYKDDLQLSAVATVESPQSKYYNWRPQNPCPSELNCYISEIKAQATFLNSGDAMNLSKEGEAYIQIANRKESDCKDPSQATFNRYLAYSPALYGGQSQSLITCAENTEKNTCSLSITDGFGTGSECFSMKLSSPSFNQGEINFATILLSVSYTWSWETNNEKK